MRRHYLVYVIYLIQNALHCQTYIHLRFEDCTLA